MAAQMIVLPVRTRRKSECEFRPAHEYTIMFKLAGGDYYHVPATEVQQICPELQATVVEAVKDGTAMTDVIEVPRSLEREWQDRWTVNDYIVQGCELITYEPISSFLTDARVYILATRYSLHSGATAAVAATHDRAAEILDCLTDTESHFNTRVAQFHLESLVAAARLACCSWEQQQEQQFPAAEESGVGGGVGNGNGNGSRGLRVMVLAALATLGPLLAELPALGDAVAEDAGLAALWERLGGGRYAASWLTPEVRERMRCVVEGREM